MVITCAFCGQQFEAQRKRTKYCGNTCWRASYNTRQRKKLRTLNCEFCAKEFTTTRSFAKFCSRQCNETQWRNNHPDKMREFRKKFEMANPEQIKKSKKKYKTCNKLKGVLKSHRITQKEYDYMMLIQEGRCGLCRQPFDAGIYPDDKIVIDHCHKTHKVRALLHSYCNKFIGAAYEDHRLLALGIEYLIKHKAIPGPAIFEYQGKKYTYATAAKKFGIKVDTLKRRMRIGWSVEEAVTIPVSTTNKRTKFGLPSNDVTNQASADENVP